MGSCNNLTFVAVVFYPLFLSLFHTCTTLLLDATQVRKKLAYFHLSMFCCFYHILLVIQMIEVQFLGIFL